MCRLYFSYFCCSWRWTQFHRSKLETPNKREEIFICTLANCLIPFSLGGVWTISTYWWTTLYRDLRKPVGKLWKRRLTVRFFQLNDLFTVNIPTCRKLPKQALNVSLNHCQPNRSKKSIKYRAVFFPPELLERIVQNFFQLKTGDIYFPFQKNAKRAIHFPSVVKTIPLRKQTWKPVRALHSAHIWAADFQTISFWANSRKFALITVLRQLLFLMSKRLLDP